tara:strand:- start:215 stop:472 length:258 start_codon:yes stop_codon:yes gene_type:complete
MIEGSKNKIKAEPKKALPKVIISQYDKCLSAVRRISEGFLIEHQEGTINVLSKHFPDDEEVMAIFETMSKDQLYAVSCLMNKVRD